MKQSFYLMAEGEAIPRVKLEDLENNLCKEIGLKINCAMLPLYREGGISSQSIPVQFAFALAADKALDWDKVQRMAHETIQSYANQHLYDYYCYRVPLEYRFYIEEETNKNIHQYYMRVSFFKEGDMIRVEDIAQWCSV